MLTDRDKYYLRSIFRNLNEFQDFLDDQENQYGLGHEILADNIDWLEYFLEKNNGRV